MATNRLRARVLVATVIDGKAFEPNDLVEVEAHEIETLYYGRLDPHPDAVAYAEKVARKRARKQLEKVELDDPDVVD